MIDYRSDAYHQNRHPELIASDQLQEAWSAYAHVTYFQAVRPGEAVFEFGGALGYNLLALVPTNPCAMLELSEVGRRSAARHGITCFADEAQVADRRFDHILCRHVLEHVPAPLTTLQTLRGWLKPHGRLVIVLPTEPPDDPPHDPEIDFHLYAWNPRIFINLARQAGLSVDAWRFNHYNGRRQCLPLYRRFGVNAYATAVRTLGRLTGAKEMVFDCRSA